MIPVSEPRPTGYQESPDTTDGPVETTDTDAAAAAETTLTTDEDAQADDSVARPGNAAG
jgi:hypothetical protein